VTGTLYARIDIPCGTGRHPWGTYKVPLVEVSPEGVNTDDQTTFQAGWFHAQSTYWGIAPNDTLQFDEMEIEEDVAEIEFEGMGETEGRDTVIKLVGIKNLEDFKKAFDLAFARKPLQDEHPDWPEDIRKVIGERKLVKGMTKRQVFCVTGSPENFKERGEGQEGGSLGPGAEQGHRDGLLGGRLGQAGDRAPQNPALRGRQAGRFQRWRLGRLEARRLMPRQDVLHCLT
jgi:hypothetical protein